VRTGCSVDNQQDRRHEGEEKDGGGEDGSGGPEFDQGRDEDSTDTLSGLVNSLSSADLKIRPLVGDRLGGSNDALRTLCKGVIGSEPIRSEGCD
jgi:hypothetical protein